MKHFSLVLLVTILAIYSCKKDSSPLTKPETDPKPGEKTELHSVQFSLNSFDVSYSDMPNARIEGLSNYINYIHYFVYDYLGNLVNRIEQDSSKANFGSITDSLKTGEYTVVVGAGNVYSKLWTSQDTTPYTQIKYSSLTLENVFKSGYYDDYARGYDLFLYKAKIKVGNRDTVFSPITPARIVGKLELKILDTLPANTRIIYQINNTPDPSSYLITNGTYTKINASYISFDMLHSYILGSNYALNLTIKVQDNFYPYNTLMSRTIPNVYVYPNKKTILTGKINDIQKTTNNVNIDTSYAGVVYLNF